MPAAGADPLSDLEVRVVVLEDGLSALQREVESLREDLRALARALAESGTPSSGE
jgi:hypothetical protein